MTNVTGTIKIIINGICEKHLPFFLIMNRKLLFVLFLSFLTLAVFAQNNSSNVIPGADRLLSDYFKLVKGKRIGLVTNYSATLTNGKLLYEELKNNKDLLLTTLFGPEHGLSGTSAAGKSVADSSDSLTGLKIYSLYGKNKKPTAEMLDNVDILVFDIPDIGARFYTYISTLFYCLQAAAENNLPILVLDRPNPIGGVYVDGPVIKSNLFSFVGVAPLPIVHGMTIGELAVYFNEENLLGNNLKAKLTVIKILNWNRNKFLDATNIKFVKPSPNIPDLQTAVVYPGTCLLEGTNISEGRGTYSPFLSIGAPFINSEDLILELKNKNITGVEVSPVSFVPVSINGMAEHPKYENKNCNGIKINVTDRKLFESVKFGVSLLTAIHKLYPDKFKFHNSTFDRLAGDKKIREMILAGYDEIDIFNSWQIELENFKSIRNKYLLY